MKLNTFMLALSLILVTAYYAKASEPSIYVSSYDDAIALSDELKIPILLIFSSNSCIHCDRLKANITDFSDIIICILDTNIDKDLASKLRVRIVPESIIYKPYLFDANPVSRLSGFKDKNSYTKWLDSNR